jgi:hypothetical protein
MDTNVTITIIDSIREIKDIQKIFLDLLRRGRGGESAVGGA